MTRHKNTAKNSCPVIKEATWDSHGIATHRPSFLYGTGLCTYAVLPIVATSADMMRTEKLKIWSS